MKQLPYVQINSPDKNSSKTIDYEEDMSINEESDVDTLTSLSDSEQTPNYNSLIKNIAFTLNGIISQTELEIKNQNLSINKNCPFYSENVPGISIEDYLQRIKIYTEFEDSTLVLSLIYIDRLSNEHNLLLTKHNIFKIIFTAILIAIKYNEDSVYKNKYYAGIFGVENAELNKLECIFTNLIDFKMYVSDKELQLYFNHLKNFEE